MSEENLKDYEPVAMKGRLIFDHENVLSPGNYRLYMKDSPHPSYIGRSDSVLEHRIYQNFWKRRYYSFEWRFAYSVKDAYEIECREWHYFRRITKLDNVNHPKRPNGKRYLICPVCGK